MKYIKTFKHVATLTITIQTQPDCKVKKLVLNIFTKYVQGNHNLQWKLKGENEKSV